MRKMSTEELRQKEVINLCDGSRLGYACDFEFDVTDGRICALIVPRSSGFLGLGKDSDIIIPWCRIECIGEDAILVKFSREELDAYDCKDKKRKKGGRG